MVAELLGCPSSLATKLEMDGNKALIEADIDGGRSTGSETPFVISAAKGLADQRIPNMRGIMMAKRKPSK